MTNLLSNKWQNIDDGSQTTFFDWASGQPDNPNSRGGCVSVDLSGYWYNSNCSDNIPFVCGIADNNTTVIPPTIVTVQSSTRLPTTSISNYYLVVSDIVFIFDISTSVSQNEFHDTKTFILNALSQFNVGYQRGVQVGIISVYGDNEKFVIQVSGFKGISDYNGLQNTLNNSYPEEAANAGPGQSALVQGLQLVVSPAFIGSGYRNTTKNHLIVYITTNSSPDTAAINEAAQILSSGRYEIMAISYNGTGGNIGALRQLVGSNSGCVLTAATQAAYTGTLAQTFAKKLFVANR